MARPTRMPLRLIDPAILPDLPTAPDNLKTVFYPDPQFWG